MLFSKEMFYRMVLALMHCLVLKNITSYYRRLVKGDASARYRFCYADLIHFIVWLTFESDTMILTLQRK